DAEPAAFLDGGPDASNAAAMALDPWQAALAGPAAVAVHDDGHMPRQPRRVQAGGLQAPESVRTEFRGCGQGKLLRRRAMAISHKDFNRRSSVPDPLPRK